MKPGPIALVAIRKTAPVIAPQADTGGAVRARRPRWLVCAGSYEDGKDWFNDSFRYFDLTFPATLASSEHPRGRPGPPDPASDAVLEHVLAERRGVAR